METKPAIAIIGAGNLGSAVASVLSAGPNPVRVWDKDSAKVRAGMTLPKALAGVSHAFLCLPSWVLRDAVAQLLPSLDPGTIVVGMSKGIEAEGKCTVAELFEGLLPDGQPWALLSGPMLATELSGGREGAAVAASADGGVRASLTSLFRGTRLMIEESADVRGTALCGVAKNVYAMGLGIVMALDWPDNARGWFVSLAVRETVIILTALGGEGVTALGPAGIGDLVATGFSPHSSNRRYGEEIVQRGVCPLVSEGCVSLPHLLDRLGDVRGRLPALDAVARVIIGHEKAEEVFGGLLSSS